MFYLYRAINKEELKEFLNLNSLNSIEDIKNEGKYIFNVHKKTIWVDNLGKKTWNIFDISRSRGYCNLVFRIFTLTKSKFEEHHNEKGKYYSKEDQIKNVMVFVIK